jgi:hypothetical protein
MNWEDAVGGCLEHRDERGPGPARRELPLVRRRPVAVYDAVEGQRGLIQRQPGDVRADAGRLDGDDRPGAQPEQPGRAAGIQQRAEVLDLGAQPRGTRRTVRSFPGRAGQGRKP